MAAGPPQILDVKKRLEAGEHPSETVRTILSWFGQKRRGSWVVERVRSSLVQHGLETIPAFEYVHIDTKVTFATKLVVKPTKGTPKTDEVSVPPQDQDEPGARIGHLAAANQKPVSIARDKAVLEACTIMMTNDFSQLPVMNGERTADGIISWKSIGQAMALGRSPKTVREAMDANVRIVKRSESLHKVVAEIAEHDVVLVRDEKQIICGIVTAADISIQFRELSEPFLLIGEIENRLRRLLGDKFPAKELQSVRDPSDTSRVITSADDLTFGEYVRLLEDPKRWDQLGVPLDRATVIERLKRVNEVRNDVMHFDPDGISPDDLSTLRKMCEFLQIL